jgi:3-hydroxy-9,10-secoandrosta-1,3,5(10)-triene-9,17-dione monooxygenase reductase component
MSQPNASSFDRREFRTALGAFATGVTVVTTRSPTGESVGLTANSFNSVSLQPPMVLWSLALNANSLPAFRQAQHWAVHVLAADQEALSNRFAARGTDKFAGLALDRGIGGVPLLHGCAARFQCRTAFQYEGGDHIIFVGEVLDFDRSDAAPLVFHAGGYAVAVEKISLQASGDPRMAGSFNEDFLTYLLGRCHALFHRRLKESMSAAGINDDEHLVLAVLTTRDGLSTRELESRIGAFLYGDLISVLIDLKRRLYIEQYQLEDGTSTYRLTSLGRDCALRLIAEAKSFEAQLIEQHLGTKDSIVIKSLLRKLLAVAHPDSSAASHTPS